MRKERQAGQCEKVKKEWSIEEFLSSVKVLFSCYVALFVLFVYIFSVSLSFPIFRPP